MKNIFISSSIVFLCLLTACSSKTQTVSNLLDNNAPPQYNSRIVFASERKERKSIYSMNSDGSDVKKLTNGQDDSEPSWSPDGKYIAFSNFYNDNLSEIVIMNADGSNQKQITTHYSVSNGAVWSPDGKSIAYYVWDTYNWEIFIVSLEDGKSRNLTQDAKTQTYPNWSPDGKSIIFHQHEDNGDWDIYSIKTDGTDKRRLTSDTYYNWLPAWSPNGKKISFWSTRTGRWEVFTMNADGSDQRQITENINSNMNSLCPSPWSPDGTELAIMMDIEDGSADIVRYHITDKTFKRLTSSASKDYCLDWSLDKKGK